MKIGEIDGELCLRLDKTKVTEYQNMFEMLYSWRQVAGKLESGEISELDNKKWLN